MYHLLGKLWILLCTCCAKHIQHVLHGEIRTWDVRLPQLQKEVVGKAAQSEAAAGTLA